MGRRFKRGLDQNFKKYLESFGRFKLLNTDKIFKDLNDKRNANFQLKQSSEAQRRHAIEKNRLEQQKKKALQMRLKNDERQKGKEDKNKR